MNQKSEPLYKQIGPETVKAVIDQFYTQATKDMIIGHFFFGKDHRELVERQFEFTMKMMGSKVTIYQGKTVPKAHSPLLIGEHHYRRRHILLRESMEKHGLPKETQDMWIALENQLKKQVMNS